LVKLVIVLKIPKLQASTTMASVIINPTVESAVLKMMTSNTEAIVSKLADKYGFDLEEALELTLPKEVLKKEVLPRKSSPKANPSPPRARERLRKRRKRSQRRPRPATFSSRTLFEPRCVRISSLNRRLKAPRSWPRM